MSLDAHLTLIEAQLRLALGQVQMARTVVEAAALPRAAEPPLPATCAAVPPDRCARQHADARVDVSGMGGAAPVWVCRGCGERLE
jgi:hypothetical protein